MSWIFWTVVFIFVLIILLSAFIILLHILLIIFRISVQIVVIILISRTLLTGGIVPQTALAVPKSELALARAARPTCVEVLAHLHSPLRTSLFVRNVCDTLLRNFTLR